MAGEPLGIDTARRHLLGGSVGLPSLSAPSPFLFTTCRRTMSKEDSPVLTTSQRLDRLDHVVSVLMDRLEWVTLELLDTVSSGRFAELQRQEILLLLDSAYGEHEVEAKSARATLQKFRLACPDVIPNDVSDACL